MGWRKGAPAVREGLLMIPTPVQCRVSGELALNPLLLVSPPQKEIHYHLFRLFLTSWGSYRVCVSECVVWRCTVRYSGSSESVVAQFFNYTSCRSTSYFTTMSMDKSTLTGLQLNPLTSKTSRTNTPVSHDYKLLELVGQPMSNAEILRGMTRNIHTIYFSKWSYYQRSLCLIWVCVCLEMHILHCSTKK